MSEVPLAMLPSPSHVQLAPLRCASFGDCVHICPCPLILTTPFGRICPVPLPLATSISPLLVVCMKLPVQVELPSCLAVLSMVEIWMPAYMPVTVPVSLVSILTESLPISRIRASETFDRIVRL